MEEEYMKGKKEKRSQKKDQIIKYDSNRLSQEQMIEIQTEAYYRAIKRIESEKENKYNEGKMNEERKYKWYEKILFALNIWICPWKIYKKFHLKDNIYDSVLVVFISSMIQIGGGLLWVLGMAIILRAIFVGNSDILTIIATGMMLLTFGSVFILAGDQFGKEKDSSKIYAYSSCMLAIAGCIIAIIQLF